MSKENRFGGRSRIFRKLQGSLAFNFPFLSVLFLFFLFFYCFVSLSSLAPPALGARAPQGPAPLPPPAPALPPACPDHPARPGRSWLRRPFRGRQPTEELPPGSAAWHPTSGGGRGAPPSPEGRALGSPGFGCKRKGCGERGSQAGSPAPASLDTIPGRIAGSPHPGAGLGVPLKEAWSGQGVTVVGELL